jgi:hypothetical protein
MKLVKIFFSVMLIFISCNANAKNILDYYLEIPAEKMGWMVEADKQPSSKERIDAIDIKDIKNGYLKLKADDGSEESTLALFQSKKGPILAIAREGVSVQQFWFLSPDSNWKDITKEIFPEFSMNVIAELYKKNDVGQPRMDQKRIEACACSRYRIVLPREGKKIKIIAGIDEKNVWGKELATLEFDGEAFKNSDTKK